MKQLLMTIFILGIFSATAHASPPKERGYRTCEGAIMAEFRDAGVVPDRTYYFAREDDKLVFFLNGSLWNDDGERVNGRATCFTSANGRNLVELKTEFGSYGMDGRTLVTR